MKKSIILANIAALSESIIAQQNNVRLLNRGISISRKDMRTRSSCSFYSWFNEEGRHLKKYINGTTLQEVEALHSHWFSLYEKVYSLFYSNDKTLWFFEKTQPKKLNDLEKAKLEAYLDDIQNTHTPLLRKLHILSMRIEQNSAINSMDYKNSKKVTCKIS